MNITASSKSAKLQIITINITAAHKDHFQTMWLILATHSGLALDIPTVQSDNVHLSQLLKKITNVGHITTAGIRKHNEHHSWLKVKDAHLTLRRTFCAVLSTFCTWNSQAYILCCIEHFLHVSLSGLHFVLYRAVFVHHAHSYTCTCVHAGGTHTMR